MALVLNRDDCSSETCQKGGWLRLQCRRRVLHDTRSPHVIGSSVKVLEASVSAGARHKNLGSWSLGGTNAETLTNEAKEALKRHTRRPHCERPSDDAGAKGYYLVSGRLWRSHGWAMTLRGHEGVANTRCPRYHQVRALGIPIAGLIFNPWKRNVSGFPNCCKVG